MGEWPDIVINSCTIYTRAMLPLLLHSSRFRARLRRIELLIIAEIFGAKLKLSSNNAKLRVKFYLCIS